MLGLQRPAQLAVISMPKAPLPLSDQAALTQPRIAAQIVWVLKLQELVYVTLQSLPAKAVTGLCAATTHQIYKTN